MNTIPYTIPAIIAIIIALGLAGTWFGVIFKETWEELLSVNPTIKTLRNELHGVMILAILVTSVTVGYMALLDMLQPNSLALSVLMSLVIAMTTIVPAGLLYALSGKKPIKHWLITSGYWLLVAGIIGSIFISWP